MFGIKKLKFNRDLVVLGGSAILALAAAVQLHNNWPGVVPTLPGIKYGSGNPATGFYYGDAGPTPATRTVRPVPGINQLYQSDVRPYTSQISSDITSTSEKLGLMGLNSGNVGRGAYRDYWTDVYDASKASSTLTGDDPTHRLTLA